ncbi:FG-GAP-like repeat-containing protein [Streptomyces hesseae]|uniref:FG-GAP-like repeat-containing protein n=1 Tax=Streptomyces hesseae TaxID=3075519 RepID=A0ABU2SVL3_9ACTN|nr:FG-GAP-like repeat-containing protein [Streptomyces sp. DSM 40473]MDT0452045.1 FG-GAP-like repeat-containing protein [Streptomyces sp. DSM 40473]
MIGGLVWVLVPSSGSADAEAATVEERPTPPAWTRTWGTAIAAAAPAAKTDVTGRQTLRMVVHTGVAGTSSRIYLVNTFSKEPVTIGHATIARQAHGAAAAAAPVALTFNGRPGTVIAPGESVYSDAAAFPVNADENLLVSIYLPNPVRTAPYHKWALTTSYTSAPGDAGDRTMDSADGGFTTKFPYFAFLSGVDVMTSSAGTIVLLGDSQTDGAHTTADGNRRWPDAYARALGAAAAAAQDKPMTVVNAGISGNRILADGDHAEAGPSALNRFDRDVLAVPNVKAVLLYEGINDIGLAGSTTPEVISGIRQLAARAHSAGLTFTVATIPPFKGFERYTPAKDKVRQEVNDYIRSTPDIDAHVDFDLATRDPLNPARLFAGYYGRGDDRLHFSDNGSQALSDSVTSGRSPAPLASRPPAPTQTVVADFTGDGIPDLVAREANGELRLRPGNKDVDDSSRGDGTFGTPKTVMRDWDFTQTVAGDFNGDGHNDLMARDRAGNLQLLTGNGNGSGTDNGTFGKPKKVLDGWAATQTVAADFNGDGIPDLIGRGADGGLHFWPGDRKTILGPARLVLKKWNFTQAAAGDFTGDGKADLIAKDDAGNLQLLTGNGNGTFAGPKKVLGDWTYTELSAFALRKGGIAHLLGRSAETGSLHAWFNLGNAEFSRPLRHPDS